MKLADKLYNLRDLERSLPEGWTEERRCQYFEWAFRVCEGLRGVSHELEQKLDQIFENKGLVSTPAVLNTKLINFEFSSICLTEMKLKKWTFQFEKV